LKKFSKLFQVNKQFQQQSEEMNTLKQLNAALQTELDSLKRPVEPSSPSLRAESMLAKGLSQSTVYQQVIVLTEENTVLKRENNMLKSSIDAIQHQLTEYGPKAEEQREEFERLQMSYFKITKDKSTLEKQRVEVRRFLDFLMFFKDKSTVETVPSRK
jgi:chromosome segregation ATPase